MNPRLWRRHLRVVLASLAQVQLHDGGLHALFISK